jgi:peptidoglycan biosynthesis protein MviN/MurJ (putative lipid II flippase)
VAAGVAAVHCAMLYTDRRFGPAAFYQAALNVFTIIGRALPVEVRRRVRLRHRLHIAGACAQLASSISRRVPAWTPRARPLPGALARDSDAKPAFFVVYAAGLGLNITFTRAYATHAGPGMAAALDYCMRGVGVPLASW